MAIAAAGPHAGNDVFVGDGSPEGVVTAGIGTLYLRSDGSSGTVLYIKESGTGSTGWKAATTAGAVGANVDAVGSSFYRANMPRNVVAGNLSALTTQVMLSTAIYLYAGDVVTNLTFLSGGTAANTPTNWWFALYDTASTPALIAQTADQTSTAWAANTPKTLALSAPYTVTTSGLHYASVMVKATAVPTLAGAAALENAAAAGAVVSGQKTLAQTSGSSLTATAPATITSGTAVVNVPLVIAT